MINPRRKGARLEYEVRDTLTEWWGVPFRRTPGSGAWGTLHKAHELVGDVVCDDPTFPFSVEVKNVENWSLEGLLKDPKCPLWKFWQQACRQAEKADKEPLLLFSKKHHPIYCLLFKARVPKEFTGPLLHFEMADCPGIGRDQFLSILLLRDAVRCHRSFWVPHDATSYVHFTWH